MSDQASAPARGTREGQGPTPDTVAKRSTILFVRMWAIAHIIHLSAATDMRLDTPWNVTVVVAALALVLRPTSGAWFVVLASFQLVDMVVEMPISPDHWMLLAFVNLTVLVTMAARRSTAPAAIEAAFPAARVVVLLGYSAAALAKYNTSFLDPVTSCATAIANTASYGLARQVDLGWVWVITVIAVESSIPILLAIPATRRHGVRIGLGFHFVLSASPAFAVVDFTAALFALFLLFLPYEDIDAILDRLGGVARRSALVRDASRAPLLTAGLALAVLGFLGYLSFRAASGIMLLTSELYLLAILLAALATWRTPRPKRPFGRPAWFHVPIFLLVVIWAASPYLGLRTTSVFTMFSSIRTEGNAPNHLFLPSTHLVPWQTDFVVIDSTNDPTLESARDGRVGVPLMELRRMAGDNPDLVVTGRIDGQAVTFGPGEGQTAFEELDGWRAKFLHFRPVAAGDQPFCGVS